MLNLFNVFVYFSRRHYINISIWTHINLINYRTVRASNLLRSFKVCESIYLRILETDKEKNNNNAVLYKEVTIKTF